MQRDVGVTGMLDHDHFMGLALEQARKAYECDEVPVGAVLVGARGDLLAVAHNAPISLSDPTAHAEVLVLREGARVSRNYRLAGTILYVTLEPCAMCVGAMLQARIDLLVYGASDPKAGAAGSIVDLTKVPALNHHIRTVDGVRAEECGGLLQRFFKERREARRQETAGEVPKWP